MRINKNLVFIVVFITGSLVWGATKFTSMIISNSTIDSTIIGSINPSTGAFTNINSIPQADQFAGSDACAKINAAAVSAITNHIYQVDATHFSGVQSCASNPFVGLIPTGLDLPMNLIINLGEVHFQTTAQWVITNSSITLNGMGTQHTIVEYTGANTSAVLWAHAQLTGSGFTNGLEEVNIRGIMFVGGASNVTDGLLLQDVNRSEIANVAAWGATGCGIHSEGDVTTSFYRDKVSGREATDDGVFTDHAQPETGFCFDSSSASGNQTTSGTVTDAAAEFVSGSGIELISAASMTFNSGTSEANGQGVQVLVGSNNNTFFGLDVEGNSGYDVLDNGRSNHYTNVIASDHIGGGGATFGSSSAWNSWDGGNLEAGQIVNTGTNNRIFVQGNITGTPQIWSTNLTTPTNIPGAGTSFFNGGIAGFNAENTGGELDIYTQFIGASHILGLWRNTLSGYIEDVALGPTSYFGGAVYAPEGIIGNSATATALNATPTNCGAGKTAYGIAASGNALCNSTYLVQPMLIGSGICTTPNTAYANCSFTSPNWGTAFSDANYAVSCSASTGTGSAAVLTNVFISGRTATNFTITLQNGTSGGSGAVTTPEIDCIGVHS